MNKIMHQLETLVVLLSLLLFPSSLSGETYKSTCIGVTDGDTISIMKAGRAFKIRLEGIDCPERNQDFGTRAKQFTSEIVFGKEVEIREYYPDVYGRMVARVLVGDKDVSLELIKAGLAWHFKKYSSDTLLAEAEEEAKRQKTGVWSTPNPIPPWEFRRGRRRYEGARVS